MEGFFRVDFPVMSIVKFTSTVLRYVASKSLGDVGELLSNELQKQKASNRAYLKKVLQNVIFLARQGLPFRGTWFSSESDQEGAGTEMNSNFHYCCVLTLAY